MSLIYLHGHHTNQDKNIKVTAHYDISLKLIKVNFDIENYPSIYGSKEFSDLAFKNWGLWNYDVVEFFFRPVKTLVYTELQASLLGQGFQLNIIEPRKIYYTPLDLTFKRHVEQNDKISVALEIPNIWGTCEFEGNLFAILGPEQSRNYFAMNINSDKSADFHRPDLFRKL